MTTEQRITRLERAVGLLADSVTQNLPIRARGQAMDDLRALVMESRELRDGEWATRERARLEGELAKVGA